MRKILLWSSLAMFALAPQLAFADSHESAEMVNKAAMEAKSELNKLKFSASKARIKAINARKAAEEAAEGADEEKISMTKNMSMEAEKASMEAADKVAMAMKSLEDMEAKMVATHEIVAGDNLWNLAKTNYGDATMWPKIQEANEGIKVKSLQIGGSLTIPK